MDFITIITLDALSAGMRVDRQAGIIEGVSVITRGAATGHGFEIDETMLRQVSDGINRRKNGLRTRLGHPSMFGDGTGTLVGRTMNARQEADRVRADVHLGTYAETMPGGGNAREYLLRVAESDPDLIGMSIVFNPGEFKQRKDADGFSLAPFGRVKDVLSVDFVDDPAANRKGLLSVPSRIALVQPPAQQRAPVNVTINL